MISQEIKINLLPKDFKNADYCSISDCALSRAAKRHFKKFKKSDICCCPDTLSIYVNKNTHNKHQDFKIKNSFSKDDYDYVASQYANKNCNKIFQVTLIPRT